MATGTSSTDAVNRRETPPSNRWGWRSLLWLVPLALVLFIVISDLFGWAYLRRPLAAFLGNTLERQVTIEPPFRVHLRRTIPVRVGGLSIGVPDWSREPHFVKVQNIEADLDWGVLIGRQPVLRRLAVAQADIRAERDEQGRASWSMGDPADRESPAGLPTIERVSIGHASISLRDAPNQLGLQLEARAGEGAGQGAGANAGLVVTGNGNWKSDPLSLELRTKGLRPILEGGRLSDIELKGKLKSTELAFDGSISDLNKFSGITGTISAKGQSLGELTAIPGIAAPSTPPYQMEGDVEASGKSVKVNVRRAEIGSSRMKAQLEYDGAARPPMLRGTVDASRLVLKDLGPTIGAPGPTDSKPAAKTSRVLPSKEFNLQALRAMNADLAVDLQELDLGAKALKPLRSLKAKLLLDGGMLKMQDLNSSLAGGTVTGSIILDGSAAQQTPTVDTSLRWNRVDLRNWLNVSGGKYFVAGRFSGESLLKGSGTSTAAILGSLNGSLKGRIDDGSISHEIVEIAGLDVAEALGVHFKGDKPLVLTCALVDVGAENGKLRSNLILFNTSDTLFFVQGYVDLGSERLDLKLVQSPKDWSPLSLRSPVTITGTLAKPSIGVEPTPVAMKVLSSIVLGAVTPLAALLPLVEAEDNTAREDCASAIRQVKEKAAEMESGPSRLLDGEGKPAKDAGRDGTGPSSRPGVTAGERP